MDFWIYGLMELWILGFRDLGIKRYRESGILRDYKEFYVILRDIRNVKGYKEV